MMHQSLFICCLTVALVWGQRSPKSIGLQPRMGYSSSIIHQNPGGSDQHAESSIQVDFHGFQAFGSEKRPLTRNSFSNEPSQAFNVGYDLSFNKNDYKPKALKEHRYTNVDVKKFENAEVITGRLKLNEKVRAPASGSEQPQALAFQTSKKLLGSSKARYATPVHEQYSQYPSQSPTFSYNTQQAIFRDVVQATRPEPIQLSPDLRSSYQANTKWNQAPISAHVGRSRSGEPLGNFNHDVALRNSESFDFSHAQGEMSFGNKSPATDSFSAASEHFPAAASDLNNLNIEAHIPKNLRGVKPFPLDTSLLKDPVLTTSANKDASTKYGRVIPIHFDIRPLKNVAQTGLDKAYGNYGNFPAPSPETLTYEVGSSNGANLRMYGSPEPNGNLGNGFMNGRDDVYKITSIRPPPIGRNFRY
ncbi:hypothetical protein HUJ04_005408 [Dendroctonus ponderosae]|nr:hypothetical protein HUJ04_005408 [Dendroctonus ponderosae]